MADSAVADEVYSLHLNGTGSRLVETSTANVFRLESDPMWRVELKSTGAPSGHPDRLDQWWLVTTPDGTEYRFGFDDDAGDVSDANSVDWVPVVDASCTIGVCARAQHWNLDRVEDVDGNRITYRYVQEYGFYDALDGDEDGVQYVRASLIDEILYTTTSSDSSPHARVVVHREVRCSDRTDWDCGDESVFPDTPIDLACRQSGSTCGETSPSFFSEHRVAGVSTQVAQGSGWRTVAWYDLKPQYPDPEQSGDTGNSYPNLWLSKIRHRPGHDGSINAFTQVEAEWASVTSGSSAAAIDDIGMGQGVVAFSEGDYVKLDDVDFGDGIDKVVVRYASDNVLPDLTLQLRTGSQTGTVFGTVTITDTGTWSDWDTATATITGGPTGTHDLYLTVADDPSHNPSMKLNWLRFDPSTTFDEIEIADFAGTPLPNRAEAASNGYTNPHRVYRVYRAVNQFGGKVEVSYDQDRPYSYTACTTNCDVSGPSNYNDIRRCDRGTGWTSSFNSSLPCDFYRLWDTIDNGFAYWNKWKVDTLTVDDQTTDSSAMVTTYDYGLPQWHYRYDPVLGTYNNGCSGNLCNRWTDWRGHDTVTVTDSAGTETEYRFHQGMDDDLYPWNSSGTVTWDWQRQVDLAESDGTSTHTDANWLAGQLREMRVLDSSSDPLSKTVHDFHVATTATGSSVDLYDGRLVATDQTESWIYNNNGTIAANTVTDTVFDTHGNPTSVRFNGPGTATDHRVETVYNKNTSAWILTTPKTIVTWEGLTAGATNQEEQRTDFYYDGATSTATAPTKGHVTKTEAFTTKGTTASVETETVYDSRGRVSTVTDAEGNDTDYTYNTTYGYLATVTNDLGHVTTTVADPGTGQPLTVTDPNSHVETFTYDDWNRIEEHWAPGVSTNSTPTTEYVYNDDDAVWNVKITTDGPDTHTYDSWVFLDGLGRTVQTQQPNGSGAIWATATQYNNTGQVHRQAPQYKITGTPGAGWNNPTWTGTPDADVWHEYTYDHLGRVTEDDYRQAAGSFWDTTATYDGLTTASYDAEGNRTDTTVDALGRAVQVDEYSGASIYATTEYTYDVLGNLTKVEDDDANATTITYDRLSRKTTMDDPDLGDWTYGYDDNGNLTYQEDGRGQDLYFEYDDLNRRTKTRKDSTNGPVIAEWMYDPTGHKGLLDTATATTGVGDVVVTYADYNDQNMPTRKEWTIPGVAGGDFTRTYTYTPTSMLTSETYPGGPDGSIGEQVDHSYDPDTGLPDEVDGSSDYAHTISYNDFGAVTGWSVGGYNGQVDRTITYGTDRRPTGWKGIGYGSVNLMDIQIGYDDNSNVTRVADLSGTSGTWANHGQRQCYEYDHLDRMTAAFTTNSATCATVNTSVGIGGYDHDYTYDTIGNLTSNTAVASGTTYTYGAGSAGPHAVTSIGGGYSFSHDGNGNQTSRTTPSQSMTLSWDESNRLESTTVSSDDTGYIYDADGGRVAVMHPDGSQTVYVDGVYERSQDATTYESPSLVSTVTVDAHGNSSHSIDWPVGTQAGDVMVVFVGSTYTTADFVTSWGFATEVDQVVGDGYSGALGYAVKPAGPFVPSGSVSFASSSKSQIVTVQIWRNLDPDDPIAGWWSGPDGSASTDTNMTFDSPSATSTLNAAYGYGYHNAGGSFTPQLGWTETSDLVPSDVSRKVGATSGYGYSWDQSPVPAGFYRTNVDSDKGVGFVIEPAPEPVIGDSTETLYYTFNGAVTVARVDGTFTHVLTDHLGSPHTTWTVVGNTVERQLYEPWGNHRHSDDLVTDKSFTGQYQDTSTGFGFYNARYYDNTLGRFISPDTIIPNPTDPQTFNRYSYVNNNPATYTDPTGHCVPGSGFFYGGGHAVEDFSDLPCSYVDVLAVEDPLDTPGPCRNAPGSIFMRCDYIIPSEFEGRFDPGHHPETVIDDILEAAIQLAEDAADESGIWKKALRWTGSTLHFVFEFDEVADGWHREGAGGALYELGETSTGLVVGGVMSTGGTACVYATGVCKLLLFEVGDRLGQQAYDVTTDWFGHSLDMARNVIRTIYRTTLWMEPR